jgi:hypothetical protein
MKQQVKLSSGVIVVIPMILMMMIVAKMPVLEMFVLPSQFIEMDPDPDDVWGVLGYWFNVGGERERLRKCDVIHWRKA